jgi:cobalt-precorrin 5A hydrolase
MQVVLGMGCDRNTSLQTLEEAIDKALQKIPLNRDAVESLATIDKKNDEVALLELAAKHNWKIHFYTAAELSKVDVPNPSAVVLKYMGTPAVSEAAAMLAADTNITNLIIEKSKYLGNDGKNATVSIVKLTN